MKLLTRKLQERLSKFLNFELFDLGQNYIFFVCGSESLPNPLEKDIEMQVISELANGSEDAKALLIEHNLRLVVYISKKFSNTGLDIEDLISVGSIGLIKAVNSFKPDKNIKLATYASRCIENEILMHLRKMSKKRNEVSINEPLKTDWEGNSVCLMDILNDENSCVYEGMELEVEKQILRNQVEKLNGREKEIMILRFGLNKQEEKTQKEVADMLGISQSYISRLEKKIIGKLKKDMIKVI